MDDPKNRLMPQALDAETLAQIVSQAAATAVTQAMAQMLPAVLGPLMEGQAAAGAEAIKAARSRRPESYNGDFDYHNRSVFRPTGAPLTPIRCRTFLGYWDDDAQKVIPDKEYLADEYGGCTEEERQMLNALEPGLYQVKNRAGMRATARVDVKRDVDGSAMQVVIAIPREWLSKQNRNLIGGVEFLSQLRPLAAVV